jgi:hypothetical protein
MHPRLQNFSAAALAAKRTRAMERNRSGALGPAFLAAPWLHHPALDARAHQDAEWQLQREPRQDQFQNHEAKPKGVPARGLGSTLAPQQRSLEAKKLAFPRTRPRPRAFSCRRLTARPPFPFSRDGPRARASRWPRPQKEKISQIANRVVNAPMAMTAILK